MSMGTHVIGFCPPDETWKKMKEVWDACEAAKVPIPKKVMDFFDSVAPDPQGVEVELTETTGLRPWRASGRDGFEVEIAKLPSHVRILRFYNSW